MRRFLLAILALTIGVSPSFAQKPQPIRVFVTSLGNSSGFTDPNKGNQDTVKDLRNEIKGRKGLALAESRDDAQIVLTVLGREKAQVTAGLFGDPARDVMVRVKLEAGEFETEMSASAQGGTLGSGGAWGRAAGKVAKQVEEWAATNRSKLLTVSNRKRDDR